VQVWLAAMPPGAGAGQLGPAEQPGQLRAAEEAAGRARARRGAPTMESLPYALLEKNHEFAIAVCEYGESYVQNRAWFELLHPFRWSGCIG
jgi:hypothetical protein